MRRALAAPAKQIEEGKFKYIKAKNNNTDRMEHILNKLGVLEVLYNHQVAILNGDGSTAFNQSQDTVFIVVLKAT